MFTIYFTGRAIDALKKQSNKKLQLPMLEVISEVNMTKESMRVITSTCPNLKSVICKASKSGSSLTSVTDEHWMELLTPKLKEICVMDASFKGPNVTRYLLEPGSNLTTLDIRELNIVKLSWFRKIKIHCQVILS